VARPSDLQLPDLPQVLDGGIPEDLWLPVVKPREPFREMSREPLKLRGEGLLGQLDGTFETLTDPGLLGLIHVGVLVGWVVDRLAVCWPVSVEVVVAVDIGCAGIYLLKMVGWKARPRRLVAARAGKSHWLVPVSKPKTADRRSRRPGGRLSPCAGIRGQKSWTSGGLLSR
jgi:hypothetical protein